MFMGGVAGLAGAYYYEQAVAAPSAGWPFSSPSCAPFSAACWAP